MSHAFLIEILVPKVTGKGQPVTKEWFGTFLKELTQTFGGATSFVRASGEGLWRNGDEPQRDVIAVVEVMADELKQDYWASLWRRLEHELSQEQIVIRAQEIICF
jgi:hypothetical protein